MLIPWKMDAFLLGNRPMSWLSAIPDSVPRAGRPGCVEDWNRWSQSTGSSRMAETRPSRLSARRAGCRSKLLRLVVLYWGKHTKNVAKHVFFRKMIYKWWMFHIWRVQGVSGVKKMWLIVIRWWEARATPKTTRTVKVSRSLSSAVGGNQPFGPLRHFGPHFGAEEGVGDVNVGSPESESLRRRNFRIQLSCFSFSWWSCLIIIHDHK
jgi:hypothetical protein